VNVHATVHAGVLALCFSALWATSCAHHRSLESTRGNETFNSIQEGTEKAEVRRLLGPPDEIRRIEGRLVLDGTLVRDARPSRTNCEAHRWAYGPKQPGTFARGGIVSFDGNDTVVWAESPVWRAGGVFNEVPEIVPRKQPSSAKGISCRIDGVRLSESPDREDRWWFARVAVSNNFDRTFATDCYLDSIGRLVVVEVMDKDQRPIFREDRNHLNSGFPGRGSVFTLLPHTSRTDEVYFDPGHYFGPLVPGRYYVRVFFRWRAERFIASEPAPFEVPPFPEGPYWDRFRTSASSGRGGPRR
jgi:hypothetical protein